MWGKTIEVLNFIGMPPKMAAALASIVLGFSLALAIIPPFVFVKELSSKVSSMENSVVAKVDSLMRLTNELKNVQNTSSEYVIELSKTNEFTTGELVEILKELAKEEKVKVIIKEKEKAIKQYQQDHLPHNKKREFTIGIKKK